MISEISLAKHTKNKLRCGRVFFLNNQPIVCLQHFPKEGPVHIRGMKQCFEGRYTIFWRTNPRILVEGFIYAEKIGTEIFKQNLYNAYKMLIEIGFPFPSFPSEMFVHYFGDNEQTKKERKKIFSSMDGYRDFQGLITFVLTSNYEWFSRAWITGTVLQLQRSGNEGESEISIMTDCSQFPKEVIATMITETSFIPITQKEAEEIVARVQQFLRKTFKKKQILD